MSRVAVAALSALALLASRRAGAVEKLGVIAVGDPPNGPDAELTELAHQLRAACRDRVGGVEEVATMRARLTGQGGGATLSELDRAYGGANAVYQNGEFESSLRTLRAILSDLEDLPETEESYFQWKRALLRLALVELTVNNLREVEATLVRLAKTEPTLQPDPDQYSPSFRRRFEEVKARVRALPRRKLVVTAEGKAGTVFVNGRPMGTTPTVITLPPGAYRIGGAAGGLRVPGLWVDLNEEDRAVHLDFALAAALRVNAGPGLALAAAQRAQGIVRAGAWLGVDRLVVVSRSQEGEPAFLLGSIYDVRRGALLREGAVRMIAGGVPSFSLGALSAFLLTGQSSRDVKATQDRPKEVAAPEPVALLPPAAAAPDASEHAEPRAPPPPGTPTRTAPPASTHAPGLTIASTSTAAAAPVAAAEPAAAAAAAAAPTAKAAPTPTPVPTAASTATAKTAPPKPGVRPAPAPTAPPDAPKPAPDLAAAPPPLPPPAAAKPLLAPPTPTPTRARPAWLGPAALGSGVLALAFTGLAVQQARTSSSAYSDADALIGPGGNFLPGASPSRYRDLRARGDEARRNTYVSAGAAVAFAGAAAVLGWNWFDRPAEPALAIRF